MTETADLTGIPIGSVMGPVNYRPLKLLGSLGLIVEPPKHQTSLARIRLATPAQLRVVDKLLDPKKWSCQMPLMRVRDWQKTRDMANRAGVPNWPRPWQFMIEQIQQPQG